MLTEEQDDGSVDAVIAVVIHETAGIDVPPAASFFEAGLTSETLVEVHAGLQRRLGRIFPVSVLFKYPSRRALSRYLAGPMAAVTPTGPPERAEGWTPQARRALRARLRDRAR